MLGFAALALNLLAVVSANPLEKRLTSTTLVAYFPAFVTNATGSGTVGGSITFTDGPGGVTVGVSLTAGTTAARRRQASLGISYTLHSGVSTPGCAAVGPIEPWGDLSAIGGLAYPPATFTFIDSLISVTVGDYNYIGGESVVLSYADGTVIGCANLAASTTTTSITNVNVNVNVNVDVNVNVTLSVCAFCEPLTTVILSACYVPKPTTLHFYGIEYDCTTPGYYTITCPYTIAPGKTITVQSCPGASYTLEKIATTTVVCSVCATPSTTVYTYPSSLVYPTSATVTPIAVSSLPAVSYAPAYVSPAYVAPAAAAPAYVAPAAAAPAYVSPAYVAPAAASPYVAPGQIAQVTGAASKAQLAGALAAVAGAVALL